MPQPAPARIGDAAEDIDTPALLIELDAFERNLRKMADFAKESGVRLRPHSKTHKSAHIARLQMELGAVGVCCQKVSEAEALVQSGINDVLISNQVVGRHKLNRLSALARHAKIAVCADDADNVADLNAAAGQVGVIMDVLVEIDVGAGRCGVTPGEAAVALAKEIDRSRNLRFAGLQAYQGSAQHIRDFAERKMAINAAQVLTKKTVEQLAEAGLECDTVGGAGTGTYEFHTKSKVWNELQCGSYVFMDADYGQNRMSDGKPFRAFENSLFVLATVMSKTSDDFCVVDAGHKALGNDQGFPLVSELEEVTYSKPSDEHGRLDLSETRQALKLGDKVRLIPGHCDPTVNLYDWYVGVRNGRVEALWQVTARGALT
ncbi:DSD1 family PLP-dependent enzyme [Thalassospiraceae bacterium LMO-SO8]|nr:DSD1 family PLP-dependent enzyme [Alphaproteobacteria bacterium LMO-S08]WND76087.1 DSD1 family PLP-dependent enzyme [Thalassospiraceae bacterium LMO-SO8]